MAGVFVNYRSVDNPWGAAGIHVWLARRFGAHQVFRDCVSIEAGTHYPSAIRAELEKAELLLAVIGPRWLSVTDPETGERLIDRKTDWVRLELVRAFDRQIAVLPVLLKDTPEDGRQPKPVELPEDIRRLATIQAFPVSQRRLGADLERLAEQLVRLLPALVSAAQARRTAVPSVPRDAFYSLVEALEMIPCFVNDETRFLLVNELRPTMARAVRYSPQRRIHTINIVRTCLDYEDGLAELLATIREIEGAESIPIRRLAAVVQDLPPELRPDEW